MFNPKLLQTKARQILQIAGFFEKIAKISLKNPKMLTFLFDNHTFDTLATL